MLPLMLRDGMGAAARTIGFALAIPPLAELVLFPLAAAAATRWGRGTVYLGGVVALVCYYAGRVSTATSVYLGHEYAASVLGSLLAVAAVGFLGTQRAFAVPLALCVLGLGATGWLFGRNRRAFDTGPRAAPDRHLTHGGR